jgi:hypothetical protein
MQGLDLNVGIDFGARGNLKDYDPVGFSPEPDTVSTWTEAATAELSFRLPPLRMDLRFTAELFPFLGDGQLPRQDCWVYINGLFVHYQAVTMPLDMTFTAAREVFNPRANRLSFVLPNATAPKELYLGEDLRLLGLAFVRLTIADAAASRTPTEGARLPGPMRRA